MLMKESTAHSGMARVSYIFTLLLAALFFFVTLGSQRVDAAAYANGGAGKYKDLILWMTWGSATDNRGLNNQHIVVGSPLSISRASHALPGGKTMHVDCQITTIAPAQTGSPAVPSLRSYQPGFYWRDGFQLLYNIDGSNSAVNKLIAGVTNTTDGNTISFNVACNANVDGTAIKIPGLVVADAESMASGEYIRASADGTWHVIEMRQNLTEPTIPIYNISKTNMGGTIQRINIQSSADGNLSAVTFMKLRAPSSTINFNIEIYGGGKTAMAFGLLVPYADFGDAPESYGNAYHLIQDVDVKPDGVSAGATPVNFNTNAINLNNLGLTTALTNYLGSMGPDAESANHYSDNADGDNLSGFAGVAEEDAWTTPNIYILEASKIMTKTIACKGTGYVAGWIDFNGNGVFDASERTTNSPQCNNTSVNLSWTIPSVANIKPGKSYVRLRLSTQLAKIADPTGLADDGESEDHVVNLVAPHFQITKTSNQGTSGWYTGVNGATYTLTVTNTGGVGNNDPAISIAPINQPLSQITVYDDLPSGITPKWTGTLTIADFSCTWSGQRVTCTRSSNLAPNASATLVLPVNVVGNTNSTLTNYASVGGGFDRYNNGLTPTPNTCSPATDTHCASAAIQINNPQISLNKSANPATGTRVYLNDEIIYTLTATLSSRALLEDLVVSDPLPAGLEFVEVVSNPGGFTNNYASNNTFVLPASPAKAPGTYTVNIKTKVVAAAQGLGNIVNTASISGGGPVAPTCPTCSTTHPVSVLSLKLTKSAEPAGASIAAVGDQLKFKFLVENTGDSTINSITLSDAFLTAASVTIPTIASIAPGASQTVEALYPLTAADFVAGKVDNTAYAAGADAAGKTVRSNDSPTSTPLTQNPKLSLVKTASGPSAQTVGSLITYSFAVTNTGNLPLTNITIVDPLLSGANITVAAIASLAPGASQTVTAQYPLTAADFAAGKRDNSATATGVDPNGASVTSDPSTTSTPLTAQAALSFTKTAGTPSGNNVGDTITYSFDVTNTGNVNLTGVVINDPLFAGLTITPVGNLAVGENRVVTATYTLTAADFAAGKVDNGANAAGRDPNNSIVTSPPDNTSTPLTKRASLALLKTASAPDVSNLGDPITYSFAVTNTGNVDLTNVVISDPLLSAANITLASVASLLVGETKTVSASYPLTAANFAAGTVNNEASASGQDPAGVAVPSNTSSTQTPLNARAGLYLDKIASGPSGTNVGDVIVYSFSLSNIGNVDLSNVQVTDPMLASAGITVPPVALIRAGATQIVSVNYPLTAADFAAGKIDNTATASGTTPGNQPITSPPDSTTTSLTAIASLTLNKVAGTPSGAQVGDTITYSFTLRNSGNVNLTDVVVRDPMLDAAGISLAPIASLAAGASQQITASYPLTAADFAAGKVDNTAFATAKNPAGDEVGAIPSSTTTPLAANPSISLLKTASSASGNRVGDLITYSFAITNTGNVDLRNVTIDDPMLAGAGVTLGSVGDLAVGQSVSVNATYPLTSDDFAAGSVTNQARVNALDPAGNPVVSPPSDTTTPVTMTPGLELYKVASAASGNNPGDTINFQFFARNTGNVVLTNVSIDDPMLAAAGITIVPAARIGIGETATLTATYTLVAADFTAGAVRNTATANGQDPRGGPVTSNPSSTETPLVPVAKLDLAKAAGSLSGNAAGATLEYTFTLTNSGNLPLTNVTIDDPLLSAGGITLAPVAALEPGQSVQLTATYSLTQADVDRGEVVNQAEARARDSLNRDVTSNPAQTQTPIAQAPGLSLLKTAVGPTASTLNGTIEYHFDITNTGNVRLTNVLINDGLLQGAGVSLPSLPELLPGQTTRVSATYPLTQADLDRGEVPNSAHLIATPPSGNFVESPPSNTLTPLDPISQLAFEKTAAAASGQAAGATIEYFFKITNTGVTTLTNVMVDDALLTNVRVDIATIDVLAPGETRNLSARYITTQADFDRGFVDNIALARGTNPRQQPVTSPIDETRTFLVQYPELQIKKTAYAPVTDQVGDLVEYAFVVTNTGNVIMRNITVDDPMLAAAGISIPAIGDLEPNESRRVVATYTLVEPDFARGYVQNQATAKGTPPDNSNYESPPSEKIIYLTPRPELGITKVLRAGPNPVTETGQVLVYTVEVKNLGNMNLAGIQVTDLMNGQGLDIGVPVGNEGDPALLEIDEVWRYTMLYTVTQNDMDTRSELINQARVTSTTTGVITPPPVEVIVPIVVPGISADDDSYRLYTNSDTAVVVGSALVNDSLDNRPVNASQLIIHAPDAPADNAPVPYLDRTTGEVIVPAKTPAGEYTINYRICEKYNPNNCADAVIRVILDGADIIAGDDHYQVDPRSRNGELGNVLNNDSLNTNNASINNVTIRVLDVSHPALSLDVNTGVARLDPDAAPGAYWLNYEICETASPSHCATAQVTVKIKPEAQIALIKSTPAQRVRIGDVVRYTLVARNQSAGELTDISVIDTPPQGFSYVEGSITIDDRDGNARLVELSPLRIEGLSLVTNGEATISYMLRVGPGAAALGTYTNYARAFDSEGPASNETSASVQRVGDGLFEETRVLGSVFLDRDGNGWQALAQATDLRIKGGFNEAAYVANSTQMNRGDGFVAVADASAPLVKGLTLGKLTGASARDSVDKPARIVISQLLTRAEFTDDLQVTTAEGTRLSMSADGQVMRTLKGDVKRGRNAQDLHISRHVFPQAQGRLLVEYHITNHGRDERGIPGVRLATVEGLVVTTDAHGRYHIEGIEVENFARGENLLVKLDTSTLAKGMALSTPNPLLKRVTQGLPTRFDFGVRGTQDGKRLKAQLDVDIREAVFTAGKPSLAKDADSTLAPLADLISTRSPVRLLLPALAGDNQGVSLGRAEQLQQALATRVSRDSHYVISLLDTDGTSWATLDADTLILHKSLPVAHAQQLDTAIATLVKARASEQRVLYIAVADSSSQPQLSEALFARIARHLDTSEQEALRIYSAAALVAWQGGAQ